MKDLYNAIRDALSEYGYTVPQYNENKLPSEETNALINIDTISTIYTGFTQYSATIELSFYGEEENTLKRVSDAFITLMDREDRATEDERALPENQSILRLLDRSNIINVETEKDEDNATNKITFTMEIYFENK